MASRDQHIDEESVKRRALPKKSVLRRLGLVAAAVPTGIVVVVVLVLMALEIDPVLNATTRWGLRQFNPLVGATMDVERVRGGLLTGITADGFEIKRQDGFPMVRVKSLSGYIHLLPLLRSHVAVDGLRILEPTVSMTQRPDSTWDLVNALPADTTARKTSTTISFRQLSIVRGEATLRFAGAPDSTLSAWAVNAAASEFSTTGDLRLRLDSLQALFRPPGASDTVRAAVRLTYGDRRLDLGELTLNSAVSDVSGSGSIAFPDGSGPVDSLELAVTAAPLSFRDIQPFVQTLNPRADVNLELRARGNGKSVRAEVEAQLGDGSTVMAEGELTPPRADEVRYSLKATIDRVNGRYLFGPGIADSPLTATVSGVLQGPSTDSLGGDVQLNIQPVALRGYAIGSSNATMHLDEGMAEIDARTSINETPFQLGGRGRLFDERPTYDVIISFSRFDVSRFSVLAHKTALQGSLRFNGEGYNWESAQGNGTLTLRPSVWNSVSIRSARIGAQLRDKSVNLDFRSNIGDGSAAAAAAIDFRDEPVYTVRSLDLQALPVTALLGDSVASSITGRFTGSWRGADAETMSLRASGSLGPSTYGSYEMERGQISASMDRGSLNLSGEADLRGGSTSFRVSGQPFARQPRFDIDELAFRSVNVSELTGSANWDTDLNGRLTGTVRLANGQSMGTASVLLDSSRVNRQEVTHARLDGSLSDGRLSGVFDAETPLGRLSAAATGLPFEDMPEYSFTDGRFENINVGAILGRSGLHTALNGRFEMELRGTDPEQLIADAALQIAESRFNDETIGSGNLSVSAHSGRYTTDATLELATGSIKLTGFADMNGSEPFKLDGSIHSVNVAGLLGADSLTSQVSADFSAEGAGLIANRTTGHGRLSISPSSYKDIQVEALAVNLTIDGKVLRIDTLTAKSNVLTAAGSGVVALASDPGLPTSNLEIDAELVDLRPLHSILPAVGKALAHGRLSLSFSGEPDEVRFRADGKLTSIVYQDLRIAEIDARVVGTLDEERSVEAAESRVEIVQLSLPTVAARTTTLEAAYADRKIKYEATSVLDTRREVRSSGVLDLGREGTDPAQLTMNTLRVRLDQDRWQLLQPSTISFGNEYRIQNFLLYSQTQQIAVDGYIDLDGEQSLVVTIEQFRMGSVADLFDYGGVAGTLNGYIDLTGPADAPLANGSLTAEIVSLGRRVGDLSLDLSYSDLRLEIDGRLRNDAGAALTVQGHLPLDLRLAAPDESARGGVRTAAAEGESMLSLKSDGFTINWILPFLDPDLFSSIDGVLSGQMDVRGTFADPDLSGSATLSTGSVGLAQFGVTFSKMRGDFEFSGNRIIVNHLDAASGSGSGIITGSISLSELNLGDLDLDISTEDFLAVNNREYRASAASDLRLTGSTKQPVLNGSVDVVAADIFLAEEIEEFTPVQLSTQDLQTVQQRFGIRITEKDTTTFSFYEALSMNLDVTLSRDTWLRSSKNPTMDIQFTGDLEVQKNPREFAKVFGTIEVIPERSRIVQFGKSFSIKKGTLTYNGPIDDPILDIQAEYDIRAWRNPESQVTITLTAKGRLDDLDVELSSDPTMEMTDIVSYIAFGRPASESLHLGGSGTGGSLATDLALSQIAGLIEDVAGSGLGLDVIEIEQQGLDARLTAGKYVHRRVYLAISQPLNLGSGTSSSGTTTPEITGEFELLQSLLLRVLSRRSSISVNLLWQYAY